MVPYPYLLLPQLLQSMNRARRRQPGDLTRSLVFGAIGVAVCAALFFGAYWLTLQLDDYDELGDFLLRLGLSWLFLTFLSFLAFSGVVTALSTFFLSEDLRLLMAAPVAVRRLFHARFARTIGQASWMVVIFLLPVLAGVGVARGASIGFYLTGALTVAPFVVIPVALGSAVTLLLVTMFPRPARARHPHADGLAVRREHRRPAALRAAGAPATRAVAARRHGVLHDAADADHAAAAVVLGGEAIFTSLQGGLDLLHGGALWTTALGMTVALRAAHERWYFAGYSKSQEARKARFTKLKTLERLSHILPLSIVQRNLLVKDLKVFLRDVTQWSQLLLLCALVLVYLYNFRVLNLDRIPYMSGVIKNVYAFVNLGMAGLVMATVAVRFVFPAVSIEGAAFWIIRTAPIKLKDFLWSKFWTGPGTGARTDRDSDDCRQRADGDRPVHQDDRRRRDCLYELRAGWSGSQLRRPLPAVQRRQRHADLRLVRRA